MYTQCRTSLGVWELFRRAFSLLFEFRASTVRNCISLLLPESAVCRNIRNVPPKSETLLQKSGVIFQWYILSERRQNSKKYLLKNCLKSQFSIEILIKKSQNFLEIFQNSLQIGSTQIRHLAQFYLSNRNHSSDLDYLAFSYKIQSIFS